MNHLKTHQTNLMAPGDPLDVPLGPLDLPPIDPPMTPKQVSWPHWTLKITSPAFQIIRRPIKCLSWKYGTSYPSPLIPWDPIGLPLDSLGSCRPTTWVKSWLSGTHQMSLLNLWDILTPLFKKKSAQFATANFCNKTIWDNQLSNQTDEHTTNNKQLINQPNLPTSCPTNRLLIQTTNQPKKQPTHPSYK